LIAAGLVAGALVPAAVAAALLVSLPLRRPLLAVRTNDPKSATRLTVAWALALVAVAAIQLGGSLLGMASITSPGDVAARTGVGLAAEAVMLVATQTYLRSRPSDHPTHR
jgi:hypothetical protein